MTYTEFIEYASAAKAREALVRMHAGRPENGIETLQLNYGNVLQVTFTEEPTDEVSESVSTGDPEPVETPTDPPAPSQETVPDGDAPDSDATEQVPTEAGAGEDIEDFIGTVPAGDDAVPDIDGMDRDELQKVVDENDLPIEINPAGPVHAQRAKVAKALAAKEND